MTVAAGYSVWVRFGIKPLVFAACLAPFAWLLRGAVTGDLGANPLDRVTDVTGEWGLRLLLLTLAVSPLRQLTGIAVVNVSAECWDFLPSSM